MPSGTTYDGTGGLLHLVRQQAADAAQGTCATYPDPDLWFREDQSDPDFCAGCTDEAVALCESCPIVAWCERKADGERVGVWAGRPRSDARDGRRSYEGHSCPRGARERAAERKRQQRARAALSATG